MSKIFRLHKGAADTITDWDAVNSHLVPTQIDQIEDPAGDNARSQITSIPSPFARIDLVNTAFKFITGKKALDGNTIHHKIVSEALDIAELFYNAEALQNKIEIIAWYPGIQINGNAIIIDDHSDLGKLLQSKNPKLRLYADTLKMFLLQDKDAYNFGELKRIFLINYKAGPDKLNIIGGTSPSTLFFSSANNDISSYAKIQFGEHQIFDEKNYYSITKRNADFIRYIYALRSSIPAFASKFKDVNNYLDMAYKHPSFPEDVKDAIRNSEADAYNDDYDDIKLGTNDGFKVEILGYPLKGARPKGIIESDFEIAGRRTIEGKKPLVLPNEQFTEILKYVNGNWRIDYRAPYYDARPLNERTLPNQEHIVYPYLTISDLMEPYLIKIPYPVNKKNYLAGNFDDKKYGFILPLKKEVFKYIAIDELDKKTADGKNRFELVKLAGDNIEAILRVPIKNGKYIKLSRVYVPNNIQDAIQPANESENKGIIVQHNFGLTIYPFLKASSEDQADYRVQLIDADLDTDPLNSDNQYALNFYKETDTVSRVNEHEPRIRSNKQESDLATSMIYVVQKAFQLVEVTVSSNVKGMIIPLLPPYSAGAGKFHFAIDFGTTNTHIEYKVDEQEPQPFEINSDIQIGSLHANTAEGIEALNSARRRLGQGIAQITELIPTELFPEQIGGKYDNKFPVRTIINEHKKIQRSSATFTLADYNIPFSYGKKTLPIESTAKVTPNLKWTNFGSAGAIDEKRVKAFLEKLALMMKNKVLMNNGALDETKITWFYPSSMPESRRDALERMWTAFAAKYISPRCKPVKISESMAPFYFLKKRGGVYAHLPMASIDIGGGTTDIVLYKDNQPTNLTSFKFASNDIFGDGYNSSYAQNGFVHSYLPELNNILATKENISELNVLKGVLEQFEKQKNSVELINFFFSLEDHRFIQKNELDISFSKFLREGEALKVIFIFFYAAIVYHLARLMKVLELMPPAYITFSGTGSKIVNVIDSNLALKNLTEFTNLIFSDVYQQDVNQVKLIQNDEPKELTCKGGLFCEDPVEDIERIKTVLIGDREGQYIVNPEKSPKDFAYDKVKNNKSLLNSVKAEVELFIDKFFAWHETFNYYKKFNATPANFPQIKAMMKDGLENALLEGFNERIKELNDSTTLNLEEPLFFYPLVGMMNKISWEIRNINLQSNEN